MDHPAGDLIASGEPVDCAAPERARRQEIERLDEGEATGQTYEVEPAVEAVELPRQRLPRRLIQGRGDVNAQDVDAFSRHRGEELTEEDRQIERIFLGDDVDAQWTRAHERSTSTRRHVTDVRPR